MYQDLIQIYKVFYILVTEILERFPTLNVDQAKKGFVMYQNFVTFTDIMQKKADKIKAEFGFSHIAMPVYYIADKSMVDVLKKCV